MNPNNVTNIADKKPATPATHTISYVLDGFSITTTLETTTPIADIIARLRAIGATPPQVQTPAQAEPTKSAGAPLCPVHGSKMKEGRRGFFCPKKVGDSYCKEIK
jgi:hypothetical protein